ncbi:transglutaminase [Microvirga sp. KLBC 81]|nr:transglutaminase [Microvirga sp. KLBC 81]
MLTHPSSRNAARRIGVGAWGIAFAITVFFSSLAPAVAESSFPATHTGPLQALGRAAPTWAWVRFCQKHPQECRINRTQPERIALTPRAWAILQQVNEHVNATILAVTDQDHWGVVDRWDYPDDGLGDCEDIQLLKRKLLIRAGLPQRALRIAAVIDDQGQGHAVLMVLTDRGDFILDNKRDAVLPWRQTGYTYIKRESTNARAWVALGDQGAPAFTANR